MTPSVINLLGEPRLMQVTQTSHRVNLGSQITPMGVMGAMNPRGVHLPSRLIAGGVFDIVNQVLRSPHPTGGEPGEKSGYAIRVREAYDFLLNNFHFCFVEENHREELFIYYFWACEYLKKSEVKSDILQTFIRSVEDLYQK